MRKFSAVRLLRILQKYDWIGGEVSFCPVARSPHFHFKNHEQGQEYIQRNSDDLQEFANQVNVRMLRALDSHANFVMVNPMRSVEMVVQHLKKNNVLVAPAIPAMGDCMRISLGTSEDMQEFWHAWDQMPPTGKMTM